MNSQFKKDISRYLKSTQDGSALSPGTVGRRVSPPGGVKQHNERIHRESKFVDDNKNLPFTFSKPKKPKRSAIVKCSNCGHITFGTIDTIGVICKNCNKFSLVSEVVNE